jgi:hypothetical protein
MQTITIRETKWGEGRQAAMLVATCLPKRPASTEKKYMVIVVENKFNNKGRSFVRRVKMLNWERETGIFCPPCRISSVIEVHEVSSQIFPLFSPSTV